MNAVAISFINIGTCPLHTANIEVSDGQKYLKDWIDLDQTDIDFFFQTFCHKKGGITKTFPQLQKLHRILYYFIVSQGD